MSGQRDWTTGPAKWAAVFALGAASTAGMAWSVFGRDHHGNPIARRTNEVVTIPADEGAGEAGAQTGTGAAAATGAASVVRTVNINTATAAELELLPGVGPAMAGRIIDYRQQHGAFTSVDQLDNVKGIGARTMEKLRPLVRVQ
jgi:comEA protein